MSFLTRKWLACVGLIAAGLHDAPAQIVAIPFGTPKYDELAGVVTAAGAASLYVAGTTDGNLYQTNLGARDAFLGKYTRTGYPKLECGVHIGTVTLDAAHGLATDGSNVYVVGATYGVLSGTREYGGGLDAFVSKYDQSCTHVWTRQFGGPADDSAAGVAVDAGGVYVVGRWGLSPTAPDAKKGFVRKYAASGALLWERFIESPKGEEYARAVAVDATGVYVAGQTAGDLDGPNLGGSDAFLRKYNPNGTVVWTRQIGTLEDDAANGVTADTYSLTMPDAPMRGVYVVGVTRGKLGPQPSEGAQDAFLLKYGSNGNEVWRNQFGTERDDTATAVASVENVGTVCPDCAGVYVVGGTPCVFQGTAHHGAPGRCNAAGYAFVRQHQRETGHFFWTEQIPYGFANGDPMTGAHASGVCAEPVFGAVWMAGRAMYPLSGTSDSAAVFFRAIPRK
jgi:hypothetical protein